MSVFIDFDQSVYPVPAKPARLSSDEKEFIGRRLSRYWWRNAHQA